MEVHRKALPVVASWTFVALWTVGWAWYMWPSSGLSWHFSVDGARLLLHGSGLNLFADAPWLQTGPLSLLVAALLSALPASTAKGIAVVATPTCDRCRRHWCRACRCFSWRWARWAGWQFGR